MFVDTAKVKLQAGKGGDGAVSFRHEIYIPKGGPDGGDGGRGGNIVFRADGGLNTLVDFRFNPELTAENGKNGSGQRSAGRSGKDLVVKVPVGTMVWKTEPAGKSQSSDATPEVPSEQANQTLLADFTFDGQESIIAHGGDGGLGNAHFKSSTRQTPMIAEVGEPGEAFEAALELKMIADIGLVGLPNAGKSTFLASVSNARPKIANYEFTTLTPQLGIATIDQRDLLIADIPGLIEGASEGKGLGHAFLRHVDRTAVLLHLVDVYNSDAGEAYRTIRTELEQYSDLASRPEIVALTKCEGVDTEIIEMQRQSILTISPSARIFAISAPAHQGITELLRALAEIISARPEPEKAGTAESEELIPPLSPQTKPETDSSSVSPLPVISLSSEQLSTAWKVEKQGDKFIVTGPKIEKFARRTDLDNYASVNRLRDILKKLGIRAELTSQGAEPSSIISIAGKEFTLVEDY